MSSSISRSISTQTNKIEEIVEGNYVEWELKSTLHSILFYTLTPHEARLSTEMAISTYWWFNEKFSSSLTTLDSAELEFC